MIDHFRGKYDFLSNFYPSDVEMDGVTYPTVEHAYQAAKSPDHEKRMKIAQIATPKGAKAAGRRIKQPDNWFEINLDLMHDLVQQKFTRHPDLRDKLLATGDAKLIEGNTWNDRFFGMVRDKKTGEWVGENHLGQILMAVRADLQTEEG
ncbi:MAG: NADAR family protein [Chloroflexota bacterium]